MLYMSVPLPHPLAHFGPGTGGHESRRSTKIFDLKALALLFRLRTEYKCLISARKTDNEVIQMDNKWLLKLPWLLLAEGLPAVVAPGIALSWNTE